MELLIFLSACFSNVAYYIEINWKSTEVKIDLFVSEIVLSPDPLSVCILDSVSQ